jgi:hypothetical protein
MIPDDPSTWLSRAATAQALTVARFPTSISLPALLRREGPRYRLNGAEYQWGPALEWPKSRVKYRGGTPSDAPKGQLS